MLNSPGHSNMRRRGEAAGRPRRLGLFRMGRRRKKEGKAKVLRYSKYTAYGNGPKPHARPNQHGSDPLSCPIAGKRARSRAERSGRGGMVWRKPRPNGGRTPEEPQGAARVARSRAARAAVPNAAAAAAQRG